MAKNHSKAWLFFTSMVVILTILGFYIFKEAKSFEHFTGNKALTQMQGLGHWEILKSSVLHNMLEPVAMLLLQIIAILLVSRILSSLFIKLGQPTVIAEILSGIILGPSLLGFFYPEVFNFLFAPGSLANLNILSQVGLILFMFVIGMELNFGMLKNKMGVTFVISNASIFIPYFLGVTFAFLIYEEFAAQQTDFLSFALFIGISMSITAFPVLARIVQEKGLSKTHMGQISIASAAFNDVTAWCILAIVIAIAKTGSISSSLYTIALSIAYIVFMLMVVKPFLKKLGTIYHSSEVLNKTFIAFIFLLLTLSSFATQIIGIHALFGAFLVGVIMPEIPEFRKLLVEKVEDVALTLLLPLFFVYTGLRTEIGLLNTPHLWSITGLLILFAVVGKFFGSAFSAKVLGESWRDSLSIGVLMNTRGLMEVIVLNIGYEMGILPPTVFVMLVIMALVTTFMTAPLLTLVHKIFPEKDKEAEFKKQKAQGIFRVLIALGNPENGKALLSVAKTVLDGVKNTLSVTALHITPGSDTNPMYGEEFARESFRRINEEADVLNIPLHTDYQVTDNIEQGVVRTTNGNQFDFLLVGAGMSLSGISYFKNKTFTFKSPLLNKLVSGVTRSRDIFYPGTLIKDKTRYFVEHSHCSVGIFVNRGFTSISTAVVYLHEDSDDFLIRYAKRLLKNDPKIQINVIDKNNLLSTNAEFKQSMKEFTAQFPDSVKITKLPRNNVGLQRFSFMLISFQAWNSLSESGSNLLENIPSTLIINKKTSRFHGLNGENDSLIAQIDYADDLGY